MILPFGGSSGVSDLLLAESEGPDDQVFLEELERASFDFFWNEADPATGLVRDRAVAWGGDTRTLASIAATGFGLTALCIGHQRGYRTPVEIIQRVQTTLDFLAGEAAHHNGFFYHFLNIQDGRRAVFSEASPVDTAILLCGALTCRQYFDTLTIRTRAEQIYERVRWPWALNGSSTFALSWRPESGFSHLRWNTYCESMMLYLLAMGSPQHPIPAECWRNIRRPWLVYDKLRFISGASPLFTHQFSHAWFDFRGQQDGYADYFANSVLACEAHRRFCRELSREFPSYGGGVWGITASDSRRGYVAWGGPPLQGPIDGTIVPAAAAGSLPFVFSDALTVLRMLKSRYGGQIWKRYGFVDAFNPLVGWASRDVLGIDVGISLLMAENARTQFVWQTFMRNPEARRGMERAGFAPLRQTPALYAVNQPAALAEGKSGKLVSRVAMGTSG
ncbi:MAG TPA: glucoamylase family protein, partial [Terriglobales bacterium]|nr:glucoamylase family protein [Terriglobales bacterium]